MTHDEVVFQTLSKVCPGTYVAYPLGGAPPLPWFTYKRQSGGEVYADDRNYQVIRRYRVELLLKEKDARLIADFEAALSELGPWRLYDADWLDSERCVYHDYRLSLDIGALAEREAING